MEPLALLGYFPIALFFITTLVVFYLWNNKVKNTPGQPIPLPEYKFHLFEFILWAISLKNSKLVPPLCRAYERIIAICKQFEKDGFVMCRFSFRSMLFAYKADILKILLTHSAVQDKPAEYGPLKSFVGEGLFVLNFQKAQKHRKAINPSFHLGILKNYLTAFNEQSLALVSQLKETIHEPWVDVDSYVKKCTMRVMYKTAMGLELDADEEIKQNVEAIDISQGIVMHRMMRPWTQWDSIYQFFPIGRQIKKLLAFRQRTIDKIIFESKEAILRNAEFSKNQTPGEEKNVDTGIYTRKKSFIELLCETHLKDPTFTTEDIRGEVTAFLAAGSESSTITVIITLMMLGLHEDVQEAAIEEIDAIFKGDRERFASHEDVSEMKYLDCVIKEILRIYPSVPIVARQINEDIHFGKYVIPKNTVLVVNMHSLHRDPEHFPNPEKFDPTRFFPENVYKRHPYAYIPFSAGARNCIGQKFAVVLMKVMLSHILRNFRIQSLDYRDTVNFSLQITTKNVHPIRLKLLPR